MTNEAKLSLKKAVRFLTAVTDWISHTVWQIEKLLFSVSPWLTDLKIAIAVDS